MLIKTHQNFVIPKAIHKITKKKQFDKNAPNFLTEV